MDPSANTSITTATIPALISTGITLLYLLLKVISYFTDATFRSPKRQERTDANSEERHMQQSGGERRKSVGEVLEQTQRHSNKGPNGERWPTTTQRTVFLPTERENLLFPPQSNGQWDNELSTLQTNDTGLRERRNTSAPPCHGKRSTSAYNDASSVYAKSERSTNTFNGQSQNNRGIGREDQEFTTRPATDNNSPGVSRFSEAAATANPGTVKLTINSSAQTENTDNFVVSKETLIAYTIAVIQQTQDYHFGQMSIVYQTAHNKAALETPSRVEELAREHFNITLLANHHTGKPQSHHESNMLPLTVETSPTTSTQETIPKSVDKSFNNPNKKSHPTGTVPPTCRPESAVFDGIPAGERSQLHRLARRIEESM